MEQVVIKRKGNPNFGKKKVEGSEETKIDLKQPEKIKEQYVFQLIKTHEKQKPRDFETGEFRDSPYQPFYAVANSGLAWDKTYVNPKNPNATPGGQRRWRYLYNYPTIWVDEQVDPEPTKEELSDSQNDLIFRNGVLRVFGYQETKLQALMLNNTFEGCERPLKNLPKEFKLLDQEKIDKEVLQELDDSFEAEKYAREATDEEMYAVSHWYGIDLGKSDDAIRKEFIQKARSNPKVFNREFINPKHRAKYVFLKALGDNMISPTIVPGKLYYVYTNTPIFDLKSSDVAEELAVNYVANVEKIKSLHDKLKKHYDDNE